MSKCLPGGEGKSRIENERLQRYRGLGAVF